MICSENPKTFLENVLAGAETYKINKPDLISIDFMAQFFLGNFSEILEIPEKLLLKTTKKLDGIENMKWETS